MFVCWHTLNGLAARSPRIAFLHLSFLEAETDAENANINSLPTSSHKLALEDYCSNGIYAQACHICSGSQRCERLLGPKWYIGIGHLTCGDRDSGWVEVRANVSCLVRGPILWRCHTLSLPRGLAKLLAHTWLTLLRKNNGLTLSPGSALFLSLLKFSVHKRGLRYINSL